MFRYEHMRKLIALKDKDAIMSEVSKLSEEDAKQALVMTLMAWQTDNQTNMQIDADLRRKIAKLEAR